MKILITGGTGFIGRPLCIELSKLDHELTLISREPARVKDDWGLPSHFIKWDMEHEPCPEPLDAYDAVIHLAGESIAGGLWTAKRRQRILDSRVKTLKALGEALAKRATPLPLFLSASAIGYYPVSSAQTFNETDGPGVGFLSEVCKAWESAVIALPKVEREVRFRFGIVLGQGGGFLDQLILPTRLGVGTVLGDGKQWMSWIHRDDIVGMITAALSDKAYKGPINAVAPVAIQQREFQKTLGSLLNRPTLFTLPAFFLRAVLGDFSHLLLDSQKVEPSRLKQLDYSYRYPYLKEALAEALDLWQKNGKTYHCQRMEAAQYVDKPLDEVFAFFCNPHNLERITPPTLSFKIEDVSTKEIGEGTIINYRLKVHGFPMRWKTLIKNWKKNEIFVDNQESGPYSIWHHTHRFYAVRGGVLMTDKVRYRLPLGLLGEAVALRFVKKDVMSIFKYRRKVIKTEL